MNAAARKARKNLLKLRDAIAEQLDEGRYFAAAAAEWARLPVLWRIALHILSGIGSADGGLDNLTDLAARAWREIPPPEREALRFVSRQCEKQLQSMGVLTAGGGDQSEARQALNQAHDAFVQFSSDGRFSSAAERAWARVNADWRIALHLLGGIGSRDVDLDVLAARRWGDIPAPEQAAIRAMCRDAKKHLHGIAALRARV